MNENRWQVLYHYTSLNGFDRIITSGYIALNDILKSNDPAEGKYVLESLKNAYIDLYRDKKITKDQYDYLRRLYFEFSEEESTFGRLQQVILSLSVCEPELPLALWRAYGDNGRGVAIGISKSKLQEIGAGDNFDFKQIEYLSEKEVLERCKQFWQDHLFDSEEKLKESLIEFYIAGYFIKRVENQYEREWRLVYKGVNLEDFILPVEDVERNVDAYMRSDDLVIYYKLGIKENNLVDTVCIGPQCRISDNEMKLYMKKHEINFCGVCRDGIEMR